MSKNRRLPPRIRDGLNIRAERAASEVAKLPVGDIMGVYFAADEQDYLIHLWVRTKNSELADRFRQRRRKGSAEARMGLAEELLPGLDQLEFDPRIFEIWIIDAHVDQRFKLSSAPLDASRRQPAA